MVIFAIGIQVLIWAIVLIALIYFVVKRIEDKHKEDFEKRDN